MSGNFQLTAENYERQHYWYKKYFQYYKKRRPYEVDNTNKIRLYKQGLQSSSRLELSSQLPHNSLQRYKVILIISEFIKNILKKFIKTIIYA